jgi:hypothetical protein
MSALLIRIILAFCIILIFSCRTTPKSDVPEGSNKAAVQLTQTDNEQMNNLINMNKKIEEDLKTYRQEIQEDRGNDMKIEKPNEYLTSLILALIDDAVDLLPDEYRDSIIKDGNIDAIVEGSINYDPSQSLNKSLDSSNLGGEAAYIARKIYSEDPKEEILIPQSIYYEGFSPVKDLEQSIEKGKNNLKKAEVLYRDQYNLALNLLVNLWIENIKYSKKILKKMPKEGVYLRDEENDLYPYDVWDK